MRAKRLATLLFALGAVATPAFAQDYGPYGYGGYGFDWDGFYSGVYGGGVPTGDTSLNAGIFAGVNATVGSALIGAEAQLGIDHDDPNGLSLDALALARGGMTFGDALIYGALGGGIREGKGAYAFGGGIEYGFAGNLSGRIEALGTGEIGHGPRDLRLTGGLAFHM